MFVSRHLSKEVEEPFSVDCSEEKVTRPIKTTLGLGVTLLPPRGKALTSMELVLAGRIGHISLILSPVPEWEGQKPCTVDSGSGLRESESGTDCDCVIGIPSSCRLPLPFSFNLRICPGLYHGCAIYSPSSGANYCILGSVGTASQCSPSSSGW